MLSRSNVKCDSKQRSIFHQSLTLSLEENFLLFGFFVVTLYPYSQWVNDGIVLAEILPLILPIGCLNFEKILTFSDYHSISMY